MGSVLFLIYCVVGTLCIKPLFDILGLTEYVTDSKVCSDERYFLIVGVYVFLWLNLTQVMFILLTK